MRRRRRRRRHQRARRVCDGRVANIHAGRMSYVDLRLRSVEFQVSVVRWLLIEFHQVDT